MKFSFLVKFEIYPKIIGWEWFLYHKWGVFKRFRISPSFRRDELDSVSFMYLHLWIVYQFPVHARLFGPDRKSGLDLVWKIQGNTAFYCFAVVILASSVHPSCPRVLSSWLWSCEWDLRPPPCEADINLAEDIEGFWLDFSISRFLLQLKAHDFLH